MPARGLDACIYETIFPSDQILQTLTESPNHVDAIASYMLAYLVASVYHILQIARRNNSQNVYQLRQFPLNFHEDCIMMDAIGRAQDMLCGELMWVEDVQERLDIPLHSIANVVKFTR
ncbi:hypothetical protein GJ744_002623 [Endocarpon pusillum]|uniref:Uncharacterized protein n=1 Tax=Endocarpon pusillum TaxID=364733 RepID=A0A8H7AAW2_9EURO|nr:hypothetical protein GJ744_002623 [Endocarpon pusillum]